MEAEAPKKIETCEDWEELLTKLANPKCSKCYGRGYKGWIIRKEVNAEGVTTESKMPNGCTAKRCSLRNLQVLQRQQKIEAMRNKKKKRVEEATKSVEEVTEAIEGATEATKELTEVLNNERS